MDKNSLYTQSLDLHQKLGGKVTIEVKQAALTKEDLSLLYSPGVAAPCLEIQKNPETAYEYTWKQNTIAVISDGSAVLWLGNIGPLAWLPVMEGKSLLFRQFGSVNAVPIVLDTQDPDEIIETVVRLAPNFGGINLEDIAAPQCFYIESELKKRLNIPVIHDDQHGTAIVTLAGLLNSLSLAGKTLSTVRIVVNGAGAAGIAIVKLLTHAGARDIILLDSKGIIGTHRSDITGEKAWYAQQFRHTLQGGIAEALVDADVFIGVSTANVVTRSMVQSMAQKPILFALANPSPEIMPEEALAGGAFIIATGRSDYPNQVNNVLAFPWLFKGALRYRLSALTDDMKLAAAQALAAAVSTPTQEHILPNVFETDTGEIVAQSLQRFVS